MIIRSSPTSDLLIGVNRISHHRFALILLAQITNKNGLPPLELISGGGKTANR